MPHESFPPHSEVVERRSSPDRPKFELQHTFQTTRHAWLGNRRLCMLHLEVPMQGIGRVLSICIPRTASVTPNQHMLFDSRFWFRTCCTISSARHPAVSDSRRAPDIRIRFDMLDRLILIASCLPSFS